GDKLLYHFTGLARLKSILAKGLRAYRQEDVPGDRRRAVCLTSEAKWPTEDETFCREADVRLSVAIPPGDGRLVSWIKWVYGEATTMPTLPWYVYFGSVPREWIRKVEVRGPNDGQH